MKLELLRVNFEPLSFILEALSFIVEALGFIVEPFSSIVEPLSSIVEPLSLIVEPFSFIVEPLSLIVEPLSLIVEPLSFIVEPFSSIVEPLSFKILVLTNSVGLSPPLLLSGKFCGGVKIPIAKLTAEFRIQNSGVRSKTGLYLALRRELVYLTNLKSAVTLFCHFPGGRSLEAA
ncbi:hypothetical protein [Nostoc sp. DedQUE03]|uniref:hypothetical protein n=1 Tax=Nostoc sp. DedQUE03 TaxID=3075389 RepID=UPI002AD39798|nr:hypothetical protein [Nostoc sp. DedQUE03]MDZ7971749.1 hypothetical protein [Nostoc sp. DedQUE03]